MDILNTALGMLKGRQESTGNGLMEGALAMLQDSGQGGLQGVLKAFTDKGMGEAVASWVGTGQNLPVSADQVTSALGSDRVQAMAKAAGVSTEDASGKLASLLPQLIDSLTPNGKIPEGGLLEQGLAMLKGRLG
jgi:uncharacterized protein YidB (DUF937 family)